MCDAGVQRSVLAARGVRKAFGTTQALDAVSFQVEPGEIVGLVGENGAGKSTLLAILAGFQQPDAGRIDIAGRPVALRTPAAARQAGIGLVQQHPSLVPTFTVTEQLRLGGWSGGPWPTLLGTDIGPKARVEDLSPGQRQRLEIVRALVPRPRVLFLDEPTSILAPVEVAALFAIIRDVRQAGTSVVLVSHKLNEVLDVADRIVILATGKVTGELERDRGSWPEGAAGFMLERMFPGRAPADVSLLRSVRRPPDGPPALVASGLTTSPDAHRVPLRHVDLVLEAGYIHAIVGVDGQGQAALVDALAGFTPAGGKLDLEGVSLAGLRPLGRARAGLGVMSGDRLAEAGIGAMTVADNLVLKRPRPASVARFGLWRRRKVDRLARDAIARWDIRPPNPGARFGTLSGGNMQRVIAAREIGRRPRVLIAVNPTQGLDARTASVLWQRLHDACDQGMTVLALLGDLDEALAVADLVAVLANGRLGALQPISRASRVDLARQMVVE